MSGVLLDTQVLLLAAFRPQELTPGPLRALESAEIVLSVLSYWEITLKAGKGKLDIADPKVFWADAVAHLGAHVISFRPAHVSALVGLPVLHSDPFDRALIAQAISESLPFATQDRTLARYSTSGCKIIS